MVPETTPAPIERRVRGSGRIIRDRVLLCIVISFALLPSLGLFFFSEDFVFITRARVANFKQLPLAFTRTWSGALSDQHGWVGVPPQRSDYYRPLIDVSYALEQLAWGFRPIGFRVTNALIVIAATLLVYELGLLLFKARAVALCGALLFCLNPSHLDSLAGFVDARHDSLPGMLFVGTCYLFGKWLTTDRRGYFCAAMSTFIAYALSKETAIVAPLALMAVHIHLRRDGVRRALRSVLPFVAVAVAYLVARLAVLGMPQGIQATFGTRDVIKNVVSLFGGTALGANVGLLLAYPFWAFFGVAGLAALAVFLPGSSSAYRRTSWLLFLAFLGGVGPAVLGGRASLLFGASAFFCLWLALTTATMAGAFAGRRMFWCSAWILFMVALIGGWVTGLAAAYRWTRVASTEIQRFLPMVYARVGTPAPGDGIFYIVLPARQWSDGAIEATRELYGSTPLNVYSLAIVNHESHSEALTVTRDGDKFTVAFNGSDHAVTQNFIVFSGINPDALYRLKQGDTFENACCQIRILKTVQEHAPFWGLRNRIKAVEVELIADRSCVGRRHYLALIDGRFNDL